MRVISGRPAPPAPPEAWTPPATADRPFAAVLGAGGGPGGTVQDARPPAPAPAPWTAAVARAADAERAIDALIAAAARGKTFTPAQLLALQQAVSRNAQAVEVLSRAADRLVGAVKQTLGAQI
jgi:hypothetical protein